MTGSPNRNSVDLDATGRPNDSARVLSAPSCSGFVIPEKIYFREREVLSLAVPSRVVWNCLIG
jgi:hypothetical protein